MSATSFWATLYQCQHFLKLQKIGDDSEGIGRDDKERSRKLREYGGIGKVVDAWWLWLEEARIGSDGGG